MDPDQRSSPAHKLVCQDVFFLFTLTSKTQLRAFPSVISTRFLWTLRVLCALQLPALAWCVSLSLMGVPLGRAGGAKPVPSGMDWLGACPGGGTT